MSDVACEVKLIRLAAYWGSSHTIHLPRPLSTSSCRSLV
nr:MAG TPA: hypothetical protein [Herelleviridae sp.]